MRDVVRESVAEHAPHELPVVDGLLGFDDEHVVRVLSGQGDRREPLGFGYAEVTAVVTSVVWLVLDQVARQAAEKVADGVVGKGRAGLRRVLRRGAVVPPRVLAELDREQLTLVRARIVERATSQGLAGPDAEALADGVVARLAMEGVAPGGAGGTAADPGRAGRA
ncbi:hypothetical protein AB0K09_27535 [Streptomyces sp. NPDC049577]|uniref:hypothetical protein n=1 Tax=Streptomyces sp. NPDC049577 TaxID=3155153 RepID=UPI003414677E